MAKSTGNGRRPRPAAAARTRTVQTSRFEEIDGHVDGDVDGIYGGSSGGRKSTVPAPSTASRTTVAMRKELGRAAQSAANRRQQMIAPGQPGADDAGDDDTEEDTAPSASFTPADDADDGDVDDVPDTDGDGLDIHASRREAATLLAPASRMPALETAAIPTVTLADTTVEDVDRLWDWLRGDAVRAFLGVPIAHSPALHTLLRQIADGESQQTSLVRSLVYDTSHLGFVLFTPIQHETKTVVLHLYLAPEFRGAVRAILLDALPLIEALAPGYRLCVWSTDPAWTELHRHVLEPLGFVPHTMFVR